MRIHASKPSYGSFDYKANPYASREELDVTRNKFRYSPTNGYSTIERTLIGTDTRYLTPETRLKAINDYFDNQACLEQDIKMIRKSGKSDRVRKTANALFNHKVMEEAVRDGKISRQYLNQTEQKVNSYLDSIESNWFSRLFSRKPATSYENVESIEPYREERKERVQKQEKEEKHLVSLAK